MTLTPRQSEVAALIAEGRTNPQVAAQLGISRDAVKAYVELLALRVAPQRTVPARRAITAWVLARG